MANETPTVTTNWAPTAKVSAGVLAASITALLLGVLKPGLSAEHGAAITTILTFMIQYFVPERK